MFRKFVFFAGVTASVLVLASGLAIAQSYPSQLLTITVAFPPGATADVTARVLAQVLTESVGQSVIVLNRPSRPAGEKAVTEFNAEPSDGYALLLWMSSIAPLRSMKAEPVAIIGVKGNLICGIVVPVGTPKEIIGRLNSAINKSIEGSSRLRESLEKLGVEPRTSTVAEATELIGANK